MKDQGKTQERLINELAELRQRVAELEAADTEQVRAERALQESEEKYRTMIEQSNDMIWTLDTEGSLTFFNKRSEEISGHRFEDWRGKSFAPLIVEEDLPLVVDVFRRTLNGEPQHYEVRVRKEDGDIFTLSVNTAPILEAGKVVGTVSFGRDITERVQAGKSLRESEERFQQVAENAQEWIWEVDAHGLYTYASPVVEKILDYKPEEVVGKKHFYDLFHPEDREEFKKAAFEVFAQKQPFREFTNRNVRQDGETVWLSTSGVPILDEEGTLLGYRGADTDITERKRAERALERRASQLATVGEIGRQIASILDRDELLHQMANLLEDVFGYRYAYIFLLDEDSDELVLRAGAGPGRLLEGTRIAVEARSINAWVARTGKPLLANDVAREPMYLHLEEVADTKSELTVPIKVKDQVIGTLDVQSTELYAFDESDLFTLQALASQAGIAIENARLYEETKRRAEEMTSVYNISVATTSTLSLDEVLKSVCEQVSRLMEVSSFYIALYDAGREELSFELALDEGVPVEKFTRKLADGAGLSGWIVQSKQSLLIRDAEREEFPVGAIVVGLPARSWLGVPLLYMDQVVGVMGVQSYQPHAFDENDQQLLSTIAAQVAIAIENARLFAETNGRTNDLALLLGTSTAISSTLDLDQILKTVARQIITSLVATLCRITLLDEAGENLVIRAVYPIREQEAQDDLGRRFPLAMVPWHRQVIETGQPVVLRQDVPELALSDEERKLALTEGVKSAALIPLIVGGRVLGVISLAEERDWERSPFTPEKVALCQSIAAQAAVAIENAHLYEELQQSFIQTIAALAAAVDAKDPYTGGHSQRTTELAAAIAQELGLDDEEVELIRYACLLHDVGKIGISEEILLKPGPLNAEEWEVVRRHPALGASIVERAALLYEMVPIILHHHERYDGQGYPEGLRGEDIPFKARILAVADAYEAMTSDRAYRPAMTVQQALATLREGADRQWDGKVVEVLNRIIREQDSVDPKSL